MTERKQFNTKRYIINGTTVCNCKTRNNEPRRRIVFKIFVQTNKKGCRWMEPDKCQKSRLILPLSHTLSFGFGKRKSHNLLHAVISKTKKVEQSDLMIP